MYEETWGEAPVSDNLSDRDRRLIEAQIAAMDEVIDEHKSQLDMEGVGFKGFIPALFGRLVNERFAEKVGEEARIKVTAPIELVRNRTARPDPWETEAIEMTCLSAVCRAVRARGDPTPLPSSALMKVTEAGIGGGKSKGMGAAVGIANSRAADPLPID